MDQLPRFGLGLGRLRTAPLSEHVYPCADAAARAVTGSAASPKVATRAVVAVILGGVSLVGLIFPPMLLVGITATVLGWTSRKLVASSEGALSGRTAAWIAVGLGILGSLLSLVIPGLIVYVWIYAAFHGGQLPPGPAITPAPFPPATP